MCRRLIAAAVIAGMLSLWGMGLAPARAQGDSSRATHVVQAGDNLFRIALRYNVSVDALMRANRLTDADVVWIGQTLVIPVAAQPVAAALPGAGAQDMGLIGLAPVERDPAPETAGPANSGSEADAALPTGFRPVPGITWEEAAEPMDDIPVNALAENLPPVALLPAVEPATFDPLANTHIDPALRGDDLGILGAEAAPTHFSSADPAAAQWMIDRGVISPGTATRSIYAYGQSLGNDPHVFSKIGDCNSEPPFFLAKFDAGQYHLGTYGYLQPVVEQFAGSYARQSAAVWTGNQAWAVLDATWANPALCEPGESPLACELRLNRPSFVLIRLGTNDAHRAEYFETNLRTIIEFAIARGVVPILGTKADNIEGTDAINTVIRALAEEYGVPLWDFSRMAQSLRGSGLQPDGFHLTYVSLDYRDPVAAQTGHALQNLSALVALNAIWHYATATE